MTITLTTTWMPRGELPRLQRHLPQLQEIYDAITVVLPPEPEAEVWEALQSMPVHAMKMSALGEGRYLALKLALDETDSDHAQYADMDRLIRWVETHPDELRETVAAVQNHDAVMIGRTEAAFATHPQAMQSTERVIHRVFSHLLGGDYDFCSGSKAFSRAALARLVAHGRRDYGMGTDVEWPLLLHQAGFEIAALWVDGLDWETADRFLDSAAKAERQREMAEQYDTDPVRWQMRVDLAHGIIDYGLKVLEQPTLDDYDRSET
jgi:hypothetical protein